MASYYLIRKQYFTSSLLHWLCHVFVCLVVTKKVDYNIMFNFS